MNFKKIQKLIKKGKYLFSEHADEERTKENLIAEDIEEAILSGEVVEERLDDPRGESRLVAGFNKQGEPIHAVLGLRFGFPIIVTVYRPGKEEWISGRIRKGKIYE